MPKLHDCPLCRRSVPEGDCPFCSSKRRAGYAVVAAVSSITLGACSQACVGVTDATVADSGGTTTDGPVLVALDATSADADEDAALDAAAGDADATLDALAADADATPDATPD